MKMNNIHTSSHASDHIAWTYFPNGLKAVGLTGIIYGLANIWLMLNITYLHLAGCTIIVFIAMTVFMFSCFKMISEGKRSVAGKVLWIGMAYTSITNFFLSVHLLGGYLLQCHGIPDLIVATAALFYVRSIPQEHQWARKTLGLWGIAIPLVYFVLWWAIYFYRNVYMNVDAFEPAIPYAYDCVMGNQSRIIKSCVWTLGNGLAMFVFSLPLYIIARKHTKK